MPELIPEWFQTTLSVFAAIAAVFFFAKYRETAAALEECERMKQRFSKDLDRYRDVPQLRALRDVLTGQREAAQDDEGMAHLLVRDAQRKLCHISIRHHSAAMRDGDALTIQRAGVATTLSELE